MSPPTESLTAGCIPYRQTRFGATEILLVCKTPGTWTFPTSFRNSAESFEEAATRAAKDQTGYSVYLCECLGVLDYELSPTPRIALFWSARVIEPPDSEESEAKWLPIEEAVRMLTDPKEKELLYKLGTTLMPPTIPQDPPWWRTLSPWLPTRRSRGRLLRELVAFRSQLEFDTRRSKNPDMSWVFAARNQIASVKGFLDVQQIEAGWHCLHAAQRTAIYGLEQEEITHRADVLREETEKISSWRARAIRLLLPQGGSCITAARLALAMEQRDEYTENKYHKIWLAADQLGMLLLLCAPCVFLLLYLLHNPPNPTPPDKELKWNSELIAPVLLVGVLAGSFSVAQSLMTSVAAGNIPERVAHYFVTASRACFGAVAALAGYIFLSSKISKITIEGSPTAGALAVAFVFGYAGERLISRIADSVSKKSAGD